MMNITIVVGPGDVGAAGNDNGGCISKEQGGLFQTWPGTSPWAVSVGATVEF
jgi:subtilase family serine protease